MNNLDLDEESQARIQDFTNWAVAQGYHVVGGLIHPTRRPNVRVFCSAPDGGYEKQTEHLRKMVDLLHHSVNKGESAGFLDIPLGTN